MSKSKTGALIVIERDTALTDRINTGTVIDADISAQLIENIFYKGSPLHDGAVIIRKNRIVAATCYLPLSQNTEISKELGTRHRAAMGISEVSDCCIDYEAWILELRNIERLGEHSSISLNEYAVSRID